MRRGLQTAAVSVLAAVLAFGASPASESAPAKKATARRPAASKPAAPKPPPAPVVRQPRAAMPIDCGAPVVTEPAPKKKGIKDTLKSIGRSKPAKLPETCILARFLEPGFPAADPNSKGKTILSLFGGSGPMIVRWPELEGLQTIADDMADAGPQPTIRANVIVADTPLANAWAFFEADGGRNGVIVLTTGLIRFLSIDADKAEREEYLRFIIAHEYAHLVLKHAQQLDKVDSGYRQAGQAVQFAGLGYALASNLAATKASASEQRAKETEAAGVMIGAALLGEVLAVEGRRLFMPRFSKSVERDADLLAVDLLVRGGGKPMAGVGGLQKAFDDNRLKLAKAQEQRDKANKTAAAAAQEAMTIGVTLLATQNMERAKQQLQNYLMARALKFGLDKLEQHRQMNDVHMHDEPAAREQLVALYLGSYYPQKLTIASGESLAAFQNLPAASDAPKPTFQFTSINFTRLDAQVAGLTARDRARDALALGDVKGARTAIDEAMKSAIAASPEIQQCAGQVAAAEGKSDAALKHFRNVLAAGRFTPDVYMSIAAVQRSTGDLKGALKTLSEGSAKLGDEKPFIVTGILLKRALDDEEGIKADVERCRAFNISELTAACEAAAAPPEEKDGEDDDRKVALGRPAQKQAVD